jgi:outer membrane protein assembly factor BamB
MPVWGIASSPLIAENLVIVQIGGEPNACLVAFDKNTGKENWRALRDTASYSSPIIIAQAGQPVLVCLTGARVVGLDPKTGKLYWEHPFPAKKMVDGIATPVYHSNYLLISAFFEGSLLLKVNQEKLTVEKVWRRSGQNERKTDSLHCCISTPLIKNDHIYGVDSYGEFRCLELLTGDRVWENLDVVPQARWANVHLVQNADKTWMFNERGELIISTLSPDGYHEIDRLKIINPTKGQLNQRGGVTWAHPAFAYKHIYVRNDEELLCIDLSVKN